ncbi:MAG: tryptophan-rich sensory protein [Clostridia bacterium]|nr:tryptophan-rich sensory protein [Clostridia bacterium]
MDDWKDFWNRNKTLIVQVVLALLAGGLASLLGGDTADLYQRLTAPPLAPPGWVFPVVWTVLYILMGLAAGLVARSEDMDRDRALFFYYVQLGMNVLWPLVFFRFEWITFGAVWLLLLVVAVGITQRQFRTVNTAAGWLLVPYLVWCLFALYLNVGFAVLN